MSHDLDTTNGIVSFADSRSDAWHQLGQQVNHLMTAEEVLREAQLANWNVRKIPLFAGDEAGDIITADDKMMTIRTNPQTGKSDYLGTVGSNYTVIQNEESASFLNALVDESGAHFETAGALDGGRRTFVTMEIPEYMEFQGAGMTRDGMNLNIAALNRHDGRGAFMIIVTFTRIVCANTETAAIKGALSKWSVRHTVNALKSIEEARTSLKLVFRYADAFAEEMQKLIDTTMEEDEARRLIDSVFLVNEDGISERAKNGRIAQADEALAGLWLPTQAGFEKTRYGLYNAVTEYVDHRMVIREEKDDRAAVVGAPAYRSIDGAYADIKDRAFQILSNV